MSPTNIVYQLKTELTVKKHKELKQFLYDKGWQESDQDTWQCATCKAPINTTDCSTCMKCENCNPKCEGV